MRGVHSVRRCPGRGCLAVSVRQDERPENVFVYGEDTFDDMWPTLAELRAAVGWIVIVAGCLLLLRAAMSIPE
jgi:hypothetical protein